jgi:hypothetical protein
MPPPVSRPIRMASTAGSAQARQARQRRSAPDAQINYGRRFRRPRGARRPRDEWREAGLAQKVKPTPKFQWCSLACLRKLAV